MKFSKQAVRIFVQLRKVEFDKKLMTFLKHCLPASHVQISISFSKVYGTYEKFINRIKGIGQNFDF